MAFSVPFREALAAARDAMDRLPDRGVAAWLVAILLVLVLPAPVAIAVIVARLRRSERRPSSTEEDVALGDREAGDGPAASAAIADGPFRASLEI